MLGVRRNEMSYSKSWGRSITCILILMVVTGNHAFMVRRAAGFNYYDSYEEDYDEKITIHSPGQNLTVSLGQTVTLPCEFSSAVSLLVLWRKDGIHYALNGTIEEAPDSVTMENDHDLIIHDIKTTDLGTYVCSFPGISDQAVVHTIRLKEPAKVVFIDATNDGTVLEGTNLTITCKVTGNPKPTVKWFKETSENEIIRLTSETARFSENSVTIENVTESDSGNYTCDAANDVGGRSDAGRINVHVIRLLSLHVPRAVINSAPDSEAVLECFVHGDELYMLYYIHWYKDRKPIFADDSKYTIQTEERKSTLIVKVRTSQDMGVFECRADSIYDTVVQTITLVQYPLIDSLEPVNGTALRWTITSHLPLEEIGLKIMDKKEENWINVPIPIPEVSNHTYYVEYDLYKENYRPGNYSVLLLAKNSAEGSQSPEAQEVELTESAFGADSAIRPAAAMYTTLCLCLVTRIIQ